MRLIVGAVLAAAARESHQVSGPFGALAAGVAAPVILEQLARQARLAPSMSPHDEVEQVSTSTHPATTEEGASDAL